MPPLGPNDPLALAATVLRADYDRHECWALTLPVTKLLGIGNGLGTANGQSPKPSSLAGPTDSGPWHIRVYRAIDADGVLSISPGFGTDGCHVLPGPNPDVTVSYSLKRPWLPGLPWSVMFRTRAARRLRARPWSWWRSTVRFHFPSRMARSSPASPPHAMATSSRSGPAQPIQAKRPSLPRPERRA